LLFAASRKANSTNNTKMSQKNEIYIEKEREANVAKELRKKQCHTCQSCRKMTQMRSGLLTDPNRNPDLLPLGPLKNPSLNPNPTSTSTSTPTPRRRLAFGGIVSASKNTNQLTESRIAKFRGNFTIKRAHNRKKKRKNKPNKKP